MTDLSDTPEPDTAAELLYGLCRRLRDLDTAVEAARQDLRETAESIAALRTTETIPPRLTLELRRRVKRLDRLEMERSAIAERLDTPKRDTVPVRVVSFS